MTGDVARTEAFDMLIRNGLVVSGRDTTRADIGIRQGIIAAVGNLGQVTANVVIDAREQYVLPGVIDVHNHPVYADNMEQMTRAAARGGVTSVISHIGAFPAWGFTKTRPSQIVSAYVARWNGRAACDFALHCAIDASDDLGADIDDLVALGVTSFKFFMAYRQRGMMCDDEDLLRNFDIVASHGGMAIVHAENGSGIAFLEAQHLSKQSVPYGTFLRCHTPLLEAEAVFRAIALADATRCPLYIPHVSARESLEAAMLGRRSARAPVFLETCPHYLVLDNGEVLRRGSLSKIAPPLRGRRDNRGLWAAVAAGDIQVIATDHGARMLADKVRETNLLRAPYGAESIEHLVPIMYSEGVAHGRITINDLVRLLAEGPADVFGLANRKGRLQPGSDADVTILDPNGTTICRAQDHVTESDYCLYEGLECRGSVTHTILRGIPSYGHVAGVCKDLRGRYLPRRPAYAIG
jgi:dihydropyrimidinase